MVIFRLFQFLGVVFDFVDVVDVVDAVDAADAADADDAAYKLMILMRLCC